MKNVLSAPYAAENPYQALLGCALEPYGFRLRHGSLSWRTPKQVQRDEMLLHLHWLSPLFTDPRPARTALKLWLFVRGLKRLRARGVPLVWTVHNLFEHEREHVAQERRLRHWLARNAAALIVHGQSAAELVRRDYGLGEQAEIAVVPHGHYIEAYPEQRTRLAARQRLGLDPAAPLLLFLGQVSPYKGLAPLIEAVARVGSGLQLVIAGRPFPLALGDELRRKAQGLPGLRLHLDFVADEQLADYVSACDLFVLPHRESLDDQDPRDEHRFEILTSGSAVLAMSFGRACLAPRMGFFQELLGHEGAFLFDPRRKDGLESTLRDALEQRDRWEAMGLRNRAAIEPFSWDRVARETASVFERALRTRGAS